MVRRTDDESCVDSRKGRVTEVGSETKDGPPESTDFCVTFLRSTNIIGNTNRQKQQQKKLDPVCPSEGLCNLFSTPSWTSSKLPFVTERMEKYTKIRRGWVFRKEG